MVKITELVTGNRKRSLKFHRITKSLVWGPSLSGPSTSNERTRLQGRSGERSERKWREERQGVHLVLVQVKPGRIKKVTLWEGGSDDYRLGKNRFPVKRWVNYKGNWKGSSVRDRLMRRNKRSIIRNSEFS